MDQACLITTAKDGNIRCIDLRTGSILYNFKQNVHQATTSGTQTKPSREFGSGLLAVGSTPGSYPDNIGLLPPVNLIASLQADRPLLHIYGWGKEFPRLRFSLPEAMSCVALPPVTVGGTGCCVTGSLTGRIYIWELPSGRLARVVDGHYKAIRSITFTPDGTGLVTSSDDASVHVWHIAELYHPKLPPVPKPTHAWSDHTLPVTQVLLSRGPGLSRVFTASLDATCKLWDFTTGLLLATYLLPSPVTAIATDARESSLVAGCDNGLIYLLPLFDNVPTTTTTATSVAPLRSKIGDGAVISVENATSFETQTRSHFTGHKNSVTTIQFDLTGTLMVSGDKDGQTIVWDVSSRQPLKFLNNGIILTTSGAVTSLNVFPTPREFLRPGTTTPGIGFPDLAIFSKIQQDQVTLPWLPSASTGSDAEATTYHSDVPYPGLLSLDLLDNASPTFPTPLFGHPLPSLTSPTTPSTSSTTQLDNLHADLSELYQSNLQLQDVNKRLYARLANSLPREE